MQIVCNNCGSNRIYLQANLFESNKGSIKCMTCEVVGEYTLAGNQLFLAKSQWFYTESTESTSPTTNY